MIFADFVIPKDLQEARSALTTLGDAGFVLAGGTAFQYMSARPGATAVDISRLPLSGIQPHNGSFRIGATTTLTDLVRYRAEGWVLNRVATLIPTHQIRNISTVGGNIARLFPWSDLPLALLVLDATIVVQGDQEREHEARTFFAERPAKNLGPGNVITAVEVPAVRAGTGFGYRKESVSNSAFALMTAAAAVTVKGHALHNVRVAVNGAVPAPMRLPAVEEALEGRRADADLLRTAVQAGTQDIAWQGREGMSDEFAQHLAAVITLDALEEAVRHARGEQP